jgi:bifunctional non-homologous end joining protein LigD
MARDGSGRIDKGRSGASEFFQFTHNLGEIFFVEPRADTAAIVEFIPFELAEEQGSKRPVLLGRRRHAKWVKPHLVAEVAYSERTREGYLRHPSFIGLREDKPADEVKSPQARDHRVVGETDPRLPIKPRVRLTHPDKVLFPAAGITKADLAAYWQRAAHLALPHISGRPLSLVRCPEGNRRGCFFQRHYTHGMAQAIEPAPLLDRDGKLEQFLKIEDASGLEAAAQIGALELRIGGRAPQ